MVDELTAGAGYEPPATVTGVTDPIRGVAFTGGEGVLSVKRLRTA